MKNLLLFLALLSSGFVAAQNSGQSGLASLSALYVLSAPSGSCTGNTLEYVVVVGTVYTCQNGTWTQLAGSGSGTVTSVTFTGDGVVDSSTPSTAVTTSGTVTATIIQQSKNTVLAGPSSGSNANPSFRALVAADIPTALLSTGTSVSLTAPTEIYVCTSTCTVTPPVPAAGYQFCVLNDDNVTTVITLAALGSSAYYENSARTAYGTAGTGTLVSGSGSAGNAVCIVGRDSTHYLTVSYTGTWTAS